jgi:endogenous inhibitor of DNA gyrase (YacG/DUF329 family)
MKCPICRKRVPLSSAFAPFCSERCKLIDLGNWASEKYVISTPAKGSENEQSTQTAQADTDGENDGE